MLANAKRAYAKLLTGVILPPEGRITYAASAEAAVEGVDFVQESLPEREDLKRKVLASIDRVARPDVIIASSTSGLLPTQLQLDMAHPERLVVGHPFNPVYLLPLVEICGGDKTSDEGEAAARRLLQIDRHASAPGAQGDRRLHRRPAARSRVARGAVAGE